MGAVTMRERLFTGPQNKGMTLPGKCDATARAASATIDDQRRAKPERRMRRRAAPRQPCRRGLAAASPSAPEET